MTDRVCCFCLGDDSDIPPFGRLEDARDFVHPCEQCLLTTHRKCLIDWFNSLPADKISVLNPTSGHDSNTAPNSLQSPVNLDQQPDQIPGQDPIQDPIQDPAGQIPDPEWRLALSYFEISASGIGISLLLASVNHDIPFNLSLSLSQTTNTVLLSAPCPQCKANVTLSMKRSYLMGLASGLKTAVSRTVQVGCIFTVVLLAVTGVLSMSSLALTTCGLKVATGMVPGPLLVKLLQKDLVPPASLYSWGPLIVGPLLGGKPDKTASMANLLDEAFSTRIVDHFKFSRIPFLPIAMYKMRQTSFVECLLGSKNLQDPVTFNKVCTELVINAYLSSLGNHLLLRATVDNLVSKRNLLAGVDFADPNNIISLLTPLRWAYDIFYRLTINRSYFRLTLRTRPRDIANSMDPESLQKMEELNCKVGDCALAWNKITLGRTESSPSHFKTTSDSIQGPVTRTDQGPVASPGILRRIVKRTQDFSALIESGLPIRYYSLLTKMWFEESKACMKYDYSESLLNSSFSLTSLTTVLWPFISSQVGSFLTKTLIKFSKLKEFPRGQLRLFCNIAGLLLVVLAKDCVNLYLSERKAAQIVDMHVVTENTRFLSEDNADSIPSQPSRARLFIQSFIPGSFPLS